MLRTKTKLINFNKINKQVVIGLNKYRLEIGSVLGTRNGPISLFILKHDVNVGCLKTPFMCEQELEMAGDLKYLK